MKLDLAEAHRGLGVLAASGSRFELAAKNGENSPIRARLFDSSSQGFDWLAHQDGDAYVGTNPMRFDASPPNGRARDEDVDAAQALLIDLDPVDTSAEARQAARELASDVRAFLLHKLGTWPVVVDSGRGVQLHVRHEPVAIEDARLALRPRLLKALAKKFDRAGAHVDIGVANPSRLARLPGSINSRTGGMARLLDEGEDVATLPDIEAVVLELEAAQPKPARTVWRAAVSPSNGCSSFWPPRYVAAAIESEVARVAAAPEGERNNALNAAAFSLGQLEGGGAPIGDTFERLQAAALAVGLGERETEKTIASGRSAGNAEPRTPPEPDACPRTAPTGRTEPMSGEIHLTDLGNARRLVRLHGQDLRYSSALDWLVWDDRRWLRDETGEVERRAQDVPRELFAEAATLEARAVEAAGEEAKKLRAQAEAVRKHAQKTESEPSLRRLVTLARSIEGVPVRVAELDRDAWALACLNGTVDLRTGTPRPHRREDLATKLAPVAFDPEARAPLWTSFLELVTGGNAALASFLQRVAGYCLTGDANEQCFFLLHGRGANGKTTFITVLRAVLGDLAVAAQFSSFLARHDGGSVRGDIARLRGARLVSAIESREAGQLDEGLVKQLTGGDPVVAAFKYRDEFEFVPTFKLLLAANEKPAISGTDLGIWRRVRLVPFVTTIPEAQRDRDFAAKVVANELSGVLAWAVRGCLEWQRQGLGEPDEVKLATNDYREEQDTLGDFLADACIVDAGARVTSSGLYKRYAAWAQANGEKPVTQKALSLRLVERGFEKKKSSTVEWRGLGLREGHPPIGADSERVLDARARTGSSQENAPTGGTPSHDVAAAPTPSAQNRERLRRRPGGAGPRAIHFTAADLDATAGDDPT